MAETIRTPFGNIRLDNNGRVRGTGVFREQRGNGQHSLDDRDYNPNPSQGVDALLEQETKEERVGGRRNTMTGAEMRDLLTATQNQGQPVLVKPQADGKFIFQNGTQYTVPIDLDPEALRLAQASPLFQWEGRGNAPVTAARTAPPPQPTLDPVARERDLAARGETQRPAAASSAAPQPAAATAPAAAPAPVDPAVAGYMAMSTQDLVKLSEMRVTEAFKHDNVAVPVTVDGVRTTEERNAIRQANTKLIETQATADGMKGLTADGTISPEERTILSQTSKGRATLVFHDLPPVADDDRRGIIERLTLTDRIFALPPGAQLDEVQAKALITENRKAVDAAFDNAPSINQPAPASAGAAASVVTAPAADTGAVVAAPKAEGPAATRYNSPTMPDGLAQNQVESIQQMLLDAGLPIGSRHGNVPDGKWGKQSQAAFENICREAGIDPKSVNFADLSDPETKTFLEKATERGKDSRGRRQDFQTSMGGIIAGLETEGPQADEPTAPAQPATAVASAATAKGPIDLLEGIPGFGKETVVAKATPGIVADPVADEAVVKSVAASAQSIGVGIAAAAAAAKAAVSETLQTQVTVGEAPSQANGSMPPAPNAPQKIASLEEVGSLRG